MEETTKVIPSELQVQIQEHIMKDTEEMIQSVPKEQIQERVAENIMETISWFRMIDFRNASRKGSLTHVFND